MRYFITSDIHSFYTPLIEELNKKGFDKNNPNHTLVVLGDVFDRGTETIPLYNFLSSLERVILVRGNHEQLYFNLLTESFPTDEDFNNGTVKTFCDIAGYDIKMLSKKYWYKKSFLDNIDIELLRNKPQQIWLEIRGKVAFSDVTSWLASDKWINYFELKDYIGVHSWIPVNQTFIDMGHIIETGYREDWRNATQTEWEDATWGCPWVKALNGWNKTGKTIICGHYPTVHFYQNISHTTKNIRYCPIFKSKKYNVIAVDSGVYYTNRIHILVIDE